MVECGICGSDRKLLCCGGCATHLTLRARMNVIKVTSQLAGLQASVTQALEGYPNSALENGDGVSVSGNEVRTVQLHSQIDILQKKLDTIQKAVDKTHNRTMELRQQHQTAKNSISNDNKSLVFIERVGKNHYEFSERSRLAKEKLLEKTYKDSLNLSLGLQSKCCQDLLEIFMLKKKRKKNGYEIVLGHNVVPDLTQLGHYSVTTINSGLERLCAFYFFLSSYLGLQLPFETHLPQMSQPKVLLGPMHEPLWLPHSPKTMMRSSSREFHSYCRLLAMLALDLAYIALKLGLPMLADLQDIARLNQLVAQIYLRIENLIRSGHRLKIYSGTLEIDLDALQDHLITAVDIELNGKSAEWNIIDAP